MWLTETEPRSCVTDKQLLVNQPDKMVADKEQKRAIVIDVTIPARVPGTDVEVGSQSTLGGDRSKLTGRVAPTNMPQQKHLLFQPRAKL